MANFGTLDFAVAFNPQTAFPLDARYYFDSKTAADAAAAAAVEVGSSDGTYFIGQTIVVNDNTNATLYVIQPDKKLRALAAGGSVEEIRGELQKMADKLSGDYVEKIGAEKTARMEADVKLAVTLEKQGTSEEGDAATYVVKQGGVALEQKIHIPKDKVIKAAEVVVDPAGQTAGTYIKITVENVKDPLYVAVPTLVNTYAGVNSATVDTHVYIEDGTGAYKISADVKAKSIGAEHLTTDLSGVIAGLGTGSAKLREDIDKKIFVQQGDDAQALSVSTLTIHKVSQAKYSQLLKDNAIVDTDVYVVSSDYLDAYGAKVVNMAPGEADTDGATYGQLTAIQSASDGKVDELSGKVFTGSTSLSATLYDKIVADVDTAKTELNDRINNLDLAEVSLTGSQVIKKISQTDGKIAVETGNLSISALDDYSTMRGEVTEAIAAAKTANAVTIDVSNPNAGGILSAFTVKQGGAEVGVINIPQDKVVESGRYVEVKGGKIGETAAPTGLADGHYIELTIANGGKVYAPVPELVDTHAGFKGTTVTTTIAKENGENVIKAEVNDASIQMKHLTGVFVLDGGSADTWQDGSDIV